MNELKDKLYTILFFIYIFFMTYIFYKGDTYLLILTSTFFINTVITAYYDVLRQKYKD